MAVTDTPPREEASVENIVIIGKLCPSLSVVGLLC